MGETSTDNLVEKLSKTRINPNALMAEFVNQYEKLIKPAIKDGNLIGARAVIRLASINSAIVEGNLAELKNGAYERYKIALAYVGGLLSNREISSKVLDYLIMCADRYVSELKFVMQGEPVYEEYLKGGQLG